MMEPEQSNSSTLTRAPMGLVGRGGALLQQFADDVSRSFGGPPMGKAKRERLNRNRVSRLVKDREGGHFDVSLEGLCETIGESQAGE